MTSKIKHRKKHQNENDSSSISSSNNSSRDTSLRPNSESGSSVSSFNPEKNKRKRLKTVDEEDSDVGLSEKSALKSKKLYNLALIKNNFLKFRISRN